MATKINLRYLKVHTQKTDETVSIPLHWTIEEILSKNNGGLPKIISNQKMNEYLKILGYKAGITQKVNISKTNWRIANCIKTASLNK